jgi:hypothetical protein
MNANTTAKMDTCRSSLAVEEIANHYGIASSFRTAELVCGAGYAHSRINLRYRLDAAQRRACSPALDGQDAFICEQNTHWRIQQTHPAVTCIKNACSSSVRGWYQTAASDTFGSCMSSVFWKNACRNFSTSASSLVWVPSDIYQPKSIIDTYGHSQLKTGHPVRSAIHKQLNGRLVLRWVTTWESLLLYVLCFLFFTVIHPADDVEAVYPFAVLLTIVKEGVRIGGEKWGGCGQIS